jgi:hypothetical protein
MSGVIRFMKKTFKFLAANKQIISYLLSYLIILCISSFHFITTILINLVLIINFVKLVLNANSNNNNENKKLNYFLYSLLIGNYLIFQTMIYSYKEILGWELAIVILFNILFIYYLYCLKMTANKKKNIISINQNNKFFPFNNLSQISSSHDKIFSCKL